MSIQVINPPVTSGSIVAALGFTPAATALSSIPTGSVGVPGAPFVGMTNVGIFSSGSNYFNITTNANAESTGNVGPLALSPFNVLVVGNATQQISTSGANGNGLAIGHNIETVVVGAQAVSGTTARPPAIWARWIADGTNAAGRSTEPVIDYMSRGTIGTPAAIPKGQLIGMYQAIGDYGFGFDPGLGIAVNVVTAASDNASANAPTGTSLGVGGIVPGMWYVATTDNAGLLATGLKVDYDRSVSMPNGKVTAGKGLTVMGATTTDTVLSLLDTDTGTIASNALNIQSDRLNSGTTQTTTWTRDDRPGVNGNILVQWAMNGYNTSSAIKTFARLQGLAGTATAGSETGRLLFQIMSAGSANTTVMEITGGAGGAGLVMPSTGTWNNQGTGTINITGPYYIGNTAVIDASRNHFGVAATFTGLVSTPASTTSNAGIRIAHGAAPTSPVNGDMWTTTSGLFVFINGVTKTVTLT